MNRTTEVAPRAEAGVAELLAHRARSASDARLVLDAAGGIIAAAVVVAVRPTGWVILAAAALAFTAFGVWGIADRELSERLTRAPASRHATLRALRGAAVALGCLAAGVAALRILGIFLGTWIS